MSVKSPPPIPLTSNQETIATTTTVVVVDSNVNSSSSISSISSIGNISNNSNINNESIDEDGNIVSLLTPSAIRTKESAGSRTSPTPLPKPPFLVQRLRGATIDNSSNNLAFMIEKIPTRACSNDELGANHNHGGVVVIEPIESIEGGMEDQHNKQHQFSHHHSQSQSSLSSSGRIIVGMPVKKSSSGGSIDYVNNSKQHLAAPSNTKENNNHHHPPSKSNSTSDLNNSKLFYPPLPPVPLSSTGGLPPLPPIPNNSTSTMTHGSSSSGLTQRESSFLNTTPPLSLSSSSMSSHSSNSITNPDLLSITSLNSMPRDQSCSTPGINTNTTTSPNQHPSTIYETSSSGKLLLSPVNSQESLGSLSPTIKTHNFKSKYFTQPTRCQYCEQFIWGMIGKQGVICKDCGFASHKQCQSKITGNCTSSPPEKSKVTDSHHKEKETSNQALKRSVEISWPNNTTTTSTAITTSLANSVDRSRDNHNFNNNNSSLNNNIVNSNSCNNLTSSNSNNSISTGLYTSNSTSSIPTLNHSNSTSSTTGSSSPSSPNPNPNTKEKKLRRSSVDSSTKDFHNLFKAFVPDGEILVTHYSCGYQGSVLKHGRLYLTEHYLCFYDNLVFDKTKQRQKVIPIATIKSIEKKSGLAPNGILIKTEERDFQFCLFLHRDETFDTIEALMLYQEKQLLSESITQKNVNGLKQALNQRKSRVSVGKSSKRSKSTDGSIFSSLVSPSSPHDDPPLISVIKSNDNEMLVLLLEYYAQNKSDEINMVDKEGYSPLHVAVSTDISDGMLIQMIKYPTVRVHIKNIDGNTPLHYFCQKFRSPECQKIAQMLIERGAEVNGQNNIGETPLHKAIFNNSVRLLMVYALLKNNANVNLVNAAGESALHYSVRLGRIDVLKTLITAGADPTLVSSKEKKTPLMLAEESNWVEIIDLLRRLEIIINSLVMSQLTQFRMALILEELSQEGALSRMDESMMVRIGCYDNDQKKLLLSLKNKKIPCGTTMPAITAGAIDLLKELENMDIKNGRWIIPQHELEYTDKIGSGISGKVYKGLYRGREVAIKVLKSADEAHNREEFLKEFHVLASLQSSMIVGLYGVVLEPRICLVMEYCSRGSLYQVLHAESMTWDRFFTLSMQLLSGISTLHSSQPQIVHRDVKSLNFLVTKDWKIKVADFGLSRFNTKSNQLTLNKTRGTSAYCAPEVFQGKEYSDRSDIYSLGVVFWELAFALINGRYLHPYGEYKKMNEFQIMLCTSNQNLRPTIPTNCPACIRDFISKCWDKDLVNRPTCLEAMDILAQCEQEYQDNKDEWETILTLKDETSRHLSMDSDQSISSR